eukprot:TRINITY_DN47906_c0_g1_i1.p1 TRINITY_DN47906_c0_g1~~TRINITY_DN47906_c0_g1_i1.p1  ORF type:complete len:102 (-),score=16.46 TRINITY_DN47906_c0_g1_i1:19-324(-)
MTGEQRSPESFGVRSVGAHSVDQVLRGPRRAKERFSARKQHRLRETDHPGVSPRKQMFLNGKSAALNECLNSVSYTHLRAHETPEHLVCRLLLEKKKTTSE